MAKRKTEHKAVYMAMPDSWDTDMRKVERRCDEMQEEGWALLTMSWPNHNSMVLMFTRPSVQDRI